VWNLAGSNSARLRLALRGGRERLYYNRAWGWVANELPGSVQFLSVRPVPPDSGTCPAGFWREDGPPVFSCPLIRWFFDYLCWRPPRLGNQVWTILSGFGRTPLWRRTSPCWLFLGDVYVCQHRDAISPGRFVVLPPSEPASSFLAARATLTGRPVANRHGSPERASEDL
jgi:hypothetical protein